MLKLKQSFATKQYIFEHSCNTALVLAALSYNIPDSEVRFLLPVHWTSDLRTPFKCNAIKGGGAVMLLLPTTLDSWRSLVTSLYTCFPTDYVFNVLHACIALQTSAGLDAILDFCWSMPINATSLPSLICVPNASSIWETQLAVRRLLQVDNLCRWMAGTVAAIL